MKHLKKFAQKMGNSKLDKEIERISMTDEKHEDGPSGRYHEEDGEEKLKRGMKKGSKMPMKSEEDCY